MQLHLPHIPIQCLNKDCPKPVGSELRLEVEIISDWISSMVNKSSADDVFLLITVMDNQPATDET